MGTMLDVSASFKKSSYSDSSCCIKLLYKMSEDDQYWPIYVETVDTNPRIVFWNKGEPESLAKIVIEGTLTRLGKRKP